MNETPTRERAPLRDGAPQQQAPHDEVLLGRYRVLERRGTGGFGTVCTCWDTRLQRRVAIKRMPLAAETGATAEEALAEARTVSLLAHPNIVTLYDYETQGAYAYLVMEYVDGLNLAELLARVEGGRLTPDECAHVLDSVARALDYAHENRVLHLDIKPTNIMIDRRGTVKLADFGMATLASAAGYGDARGGTVGYMPPEQIEGMLVDERADVFSLAVVVWQALTGSNPFLARTAAESLSKINRGPSGRTRPELDAEGQQALLEALCPSPSGRMASALQLAEELDASLGDAQEGASSLRELVEQAEEDDGQDSRRARRTPALTLDAPRAAAALRRGLTALGTFAVLRVVLPAAPGATPQVVAVASLLCCAAAAAWPPLGAPLATLALAYVLAATSVTGATLLIAMALGAGVVVWWALAGRRDHLSSLAVLLPCCLPSPVSGAALAGFALDPAPAAATGALGYLVGVLFHACATSGFAGGALLVALGSTCSDPTFWVMLAASAACAAVSSAVALRGSVAAGILGQALGLACLLGFGVLAASMENAGIWASLDWDTMVVAILLFVLLCIATVLRGPLYEGPEGGGTHEFPQ